MPSEAFWNGWKDVHRRMGVFRSAAHGARLTDETVMAFACVAGEQVPDAYVDNGDEDDRGRGSLTALAVLGDRIIRLDSFYAGHGGGDVGLGEVQIAEAMTTELRAVGTVAKSEAGGLDPDYFGAEGMVLRLLLPEGLRRRDEGAWWEVDLSTVAGYKKRNAIYQAWRTVLRT